MTEIIILVVKTIVGYVILLFLTKNLLGMVVRGFYGNIAKAEIEEANTIVRDEAIKLNRSNLLVTIFFILLTILFYWLLFYFFNIGVVITAIMLMIARLPDLLYEIKTGIKVTSKIGPQGITKFIMLLFTWGALVLLWFSLHNMA